MEESGSPRGLAGRLVSRLRASRGHRTSDPAPATPPDAPDLPTEPTVSVVVPVYAVEEWVGDCLDSVLGQTYAHLDVVVVDDGSPDGSMAIVEQYAAKDDRVRIVRQTNAGLGAARNRGIEEARGELITFVDSDDTLPDYAIAATRALTAGQRVGLLRGCVGAAAELHDLRPEALVAPAPPGAPARRAARGGARGAGEHLRLHQGVPAGVRRPRSTCASRWECATRTRSRSPGPTSRPPASTSFPTSSTAGAPAATARRSPSRRLARTTSTTGCSPSTRWPGWCGRAAARRRWWAGTARCSSSTSSPTSAPASTPTTTTSPRCARRSRASWTERLPAPGPTSTFGTGSPPGRWSTRAARR